MSPTPSQEPLKGPPLFEDKSRWLWVGLVVFAVVVVVGLAVAKPAYRQVKVWRAGRLVAEGNEAFAAADMTAVARIVKAAMGLAPDSPPVLRLAAWYCSRTDIAEGVNYWQMLLRSGTATRQDRQEFARFAQKLERFDLSGELIDELLSRDNDDRTNRLLRLDQNALLGNWPLVVRGAEVMREKDPADSYLQFMLARAYLAIREPELGPKAADLLRTLAKTENPQRLPALRTLASMYGPPPDEMRRIADQLDVATNALADRLLAWDVRERLAPDRRAEVQAQAFAVVPAVPTPADAVTAVEWFRARRRADLAIRLVPLDRARSDGSLLLAHSELLADLRRWDDLGDLLKEPKLPLNPVALACLRALHAHGTGREDETEAQLRRAVKNAGQVVPLLQSVAAFAGQMGRPAIVEEAWTAMLQNPLTVVPASVMLLRQARQRDDLVIERLVYRYLSVPLGQQPEVRFQHAYLRALFDEQVADAHAELTDLAAKDLRDVRLRMALALAKLRLGKAEEALTLCESGDIAWAGQEPRWRVVYAAALQANGQRAASRKIAAAIPIGGLKVPERALLQEVLKKL